MARLSETRSGTVSVWFRPPRLGGLQSFDLFRELSRGLLEGNGIHQEMFQNRSIRFVFVSSYL